MKHILILPDGTRLSSGADAPSAIKSVTLTQSVNDGTCLTPGSAVAAELEVSVFADRLDITAGQEVQLLRCDASGAEQPVGIFLLEKPTRTSPNTLRLRGFDRLVKLDKDLTDWAASLTGWPYPLLTFAKMVCAECGVTLVTEEVPNGGYPITRFSRPGVTGRQLIRWLGEIACRFCTANSSGQLEFGWYTHSGVKLAPTGDSYYFQNGLRYEDYTVEADANSYILSDNPLLGSDGTEALERVRQELSGLTYTPCRVEIPAMPELQPGHIFTATTPGGEITALVMTKTAAPGKTTLECTGSPRSSTADKPLSQLIREEADTAARNQVDAQTQQDVFNRLTDNGAVQGVYLEDGQLYINASYIKTGQLAADLIRAGVLQSGDGTSFYLDLDNGILKGRFTEFTVSGQTVDAIAREKADAARQSAAADATNKANAAQQSAISAAAADATNKANSALSSANGYTDSLNSLLNQQEVFNRLTANGTLPGLYMENGQLYINASYLKSGIIDAAVVQVVNLIAEKLKSVSGNTTLEVDGAQLNFFVDGHNSISVNNDRDGLPIIYLDDYIDGVRTNSAEFSPHHLKIGGTSTAPLFSVSVPALYEGHSTMHVDSINPGKTKLFSGNVTMGNSCIVPNTGLYDLFAVKLGDSGTTYDTVVLAYKTGSVIRGVGGWAGTESQSKQLYFFSAAVSGDTWTVEDAGVHNLYIGGTVEEGVRLNLKEIIGVI